MHKKRGIELNDSGCFGSQSCRQALPHCGWTDLLAGVGSTGAGWSEGDQGPFVRWNSINTLVWPSERHEVLYGKCCPAAIYPRSLQLCWSCNLLRAALLGFFHIHSEFLLANNVFLGSLFPCFSSQRNASTSQQPPLLPSGFHKSFGSFPFIFFPFQFHFSSYQVILNANIFIGQVTSDAEMLEMREVTSCCCCC